MGLEERQKLILALVIRDYIESAQPVGSKNLVENYGLNFSPATVRGEMAALTEAGLLRQPHTSAGRVPTEEGYRFFVRQLMGHTDLSTQTKRTITHQFYQAGHDVDQWMRLAASILAHQSQAAALVTAPHPEEARFKHIELISTHGHQVLMVLVLTGGDVRQQMLVLAEPVDQEILSSVADRLNQSCSDKTSEGIDSLSEQAEKLEKDVIRLIVDEMKRSSEVLGGEVYRDGLSNVLAEPEFTEVGAARRALRVFEERAFLEDLLTRTVLATSIGGVQVIIGGEGTWEELRECSMVLSRYGVPGLATGTLGVLGPIRMPYGRTISTVRFIADLLSDLVVEIS
jgi:heat-inducible transcriptional repressor